jgi:DNA-directed RNA polymerase specialized sigma24 family protein
MGGFDHFFADNYDQVVRSLTLAVGDRARAEDAAQEAFAKAYRRWPSVAQMERPVGWVLVVAMNQMKRWIKRAEREFGESAADDTDDHAEAIASSESIRGALDARRCQVATSRLPSGWSVCPIRTRTAMRCRFVAPIARARESRLWACRVRRLG